jgi:hypothetical protein
MLLSKNKLYNTFFAVVVNKNNTDMPYDLVVVGGGIAGLALAYRCGMRVLVLELNERVAGRMKSEHGMNVGAWRIADNHREMLSLAKELNVVMRLTYSSKERPELAHIEVEPGLSAKSTLLKHCSLQKVGKIEQATGYPGTLEGKDQTYVGKNVKDYWEPASKYGMNVFVRKLAAKINATSGKQVKTSCRVYAVEYDDKDELYTVSYVHRSQKGFLKHSLRCKKLAFACLSNAWPRTNFHVSIEPLQHVTGSVPLCRMFFKAVNLKPMHLNTMSQAGQLIAADKKTLVMYTSGETAEMQNSMYTQDKDQHKAFAHALIRRYAPDVVLDEKADVQSVFWHDAVTYWQPSIGSSSLVTKCAVPHPINLPGFVVVGEAFSNMQGWAEGAMRTTNVAASYLEHGGNGGHRVFRSKPKNTIVYDGRVIDLKPWFDRHPGGKQALLNHLPDTDTTQAWRAVHMRTPHALKHLLNLQIGFIQKRATS